MKSFFLLKRLKSTPFNFLMGLVSVVLFLAAITLLIVPFGVTKFLARYTPVGRVPLPISLG